MNKFPTLYSRTQTEATQTWQIVVDDDSYYTVSGQIDGQKTQSSPTKCEGKNLGRANETTPQQQAQADAESKFKKKLKTGYFEDIKKIDSFYFVEAMLATPLNKIKGGIKFPAILQCKYNGVRCLTTKDGMFSRKGERFVSSKHIFEDLSPLFEQEPDAVLDGELYNYDLRAKLNELMSLVRKTVDVTAEDLEKSKNIVQYHVYDCYGVSGTTEDTPYSIRKYHLDKIADTFKYTRQVKDYIVRTQAEVDKVYAEFITDGQEGGIIRYPDNKYEHKRSKFIVKLKDTDDSEYFVTGILPGKGNWAGMAKIINCKMDDGREFDATFKGTQEQAKICIDNKDIIIGKKYTIFYNGFTGLGVPNYAQFCWNNSCPDFLK